MINTHPWNTRSKTASDKSLAVHVRRKLGRRRLDAIFGVNLADDELAAEYRRTLSTISTQPANANPAELMAVCNIWIIEHNDDSDDSDDIPLV